MHLGYVACPAVCVALFGDALYTYLNLEIPRYITFDILRSVGFLRLLGNACEITSFPR